MQKIRVGGLRGLGRAEVTKDVKGIEKAEGAEKTEKKDVGLTV